MTDKEAGENWRAAMAEKNLFELARLQAENNALLREMARPKTSAELVTQLRESSTPEEWSHILAERVESASLAEIVDTMAQLEGYQDRSDKDNKERIARNEKLGLDEHGMPVYEPPIVNK